MYQNEIRAVWGKVAKCYCSRYGSIQVPGDFGFKKSAIAYIYYFFFFISSIF